MAKDILSTDIQLRSGQVMRRGKKYGCHLDLMDGEDPDGCVLDDGSNDCCIYGTHVSGRPRKTRWTCKYWREVKP